MGEKEWDPSNVLDVFGDDLARKILVLASERPLAAEDLADELDVSRPTIYRRVNALIDYDLIREHQQIDIKGNHYQIFETTLKRISFEVADGGYDISLEMRQSLADQFESFWDDLEGADRAGESAVEAHGDPAPTEDGETSG